ncbi:TPA: hypothetical protein ACG3RW_003970 [Clostridioides difficile]|jgi:hypothetical protein
MRKISIVALILALSVVFTACTSDEMKLYNAFIKSEDITSMESDVNINFSFEAEGFPEEAQQGFQEVAKMLKDSEVSFHQKMVQNKEKTAAKAQVDMGLNFGGMKTDMNVWVNTDMSSDTPKMIEIIKMPPLFMSQMSPEDESKEYIVYDFEDMMNSNEEKIDFKELMNFSREMQPKILDFMKNYHKNFDLDFKIASYRGRQTIDGKTLLIYQVKLDDKSFKDLVRYIVNNSMDNEETMKFIEEYMNIVMSSAQIPEAEKEVAKEEINKGIEDLQKDLPKLKKQFNDFMDTFEDIKVLGEKGIVIEYGINNDGYIVYEDGKIDLNIDLKAIGNMLDKDIEEDMGTLKLGINYNAKIYNINKDINIDLPVVNEKNAIYYNDLMDQVNN